MTVTEPFHHALQPVDADSTDDGGAAVAASAAVATAAAANVMIVMKLTDGGKCESIIGQAVRSFGN